VDVILDEVKEEILGLMSKGEILLVGTIQKIL